MAGLAVERWHHDLNVLMLEVQTGVLGPLAPPDDKRRSAVYRMYDACRYGRMYINSLVHSFRPQFSSTVHSSAVKAGVLMSDT